MTAADPFAGPAPDEVLLPSAPLTRVIAQVRFPPNLALDEAGEVSGFQKAIRVDYPLLQKDEIREITVGPTGEVKVSAGVLWKFAEAAEKWRVTLSNTFVALETSAYENRADFLRRFDAIVEAADAAFRPQIAERIGLRYVNRMHGPQLDRLSSLVRSEMLGIAGSPIADRILLNMTETHLDVPDLAGQMLLRHGRLPPQATYDPGALEPIGVPSWVLDFDTYRNQRIAFDPAALSDLTRELADRARRMFRWAVKEEFLREYGGSP